MKAEINGNREIIEINSNSEIFEIESNKENHGNRLTRKDALKKAGKYAAFTAAAAIVMLSPRVAQALSTEPEGRGAGYFE